MADLSKKNVRGGGLPSSPFDWNSHTITTTNFGAFLPVKMVHLRAGDSIKGNVMQKSWLASLPAPVFGKFKNNTRAFFTKYSRIFKHYNDLLAGNLIKNPYTGGFDAIKHAPYICGMDILKMFVENCGFDEPQEIWDSDNYDYVDNVPSTPYLLINKDKEMDYFNNPNLLCYPVQVAETSSSSLTFSPVKVKCDFKICCSNNETTFNIFSNAFNYPSPLLDSLTDSIEVETDVTLDANYVGFRFTRIGKLIYSLLLSLQYRFNLNWDINAFPDLDFTVESDRYKSLWSLMFPVSILPLLGYVRTYQDWVLPSRYYNNRTFVDWRYFNENIQEYGSFDWQPTPPSTFALMYPLRSVFSNYTTFGDSSFPSASSLTNLLRDVLTIIVRSYYTEDYFMSAYADMVEPGIEYPSRTIQATIDSWDSVGTSSNGDKDADILRGPEGMENPYEKGAVINKNMPYISQFSLLSVGRLQDMLLSGLIGGTKIQDWLKNEFGITPSKDSMMLTDYLGCDTQPVMIGDIYSQTTTKSDPDAFGNYLGEVGGRGIINTNEGFKIDYSTNEEGYLYIVHELVSVPFYYQGLTDDVLETGRYDFYNPRFDGIGFDPVSHLEMFNMPITIDEGAQTINPFGNKVFGFQPTYSRKKIPHDDLLGDFACPARNTELLPWFVSRDFSRASKEGESSEMSQIIDMNWQSALADANVNDFDRIFYVNDGYNDPVRSLFVFNLTKNSHMLPIKQSFDFTSGKDSITNSDGSVLTN